MIPTLTPGTRLGPYEILAPLGAGGMGEVYRAKDTRLGRDVAVKVLPQHLSAAPDVRARFEREAKIISGLNHPNICVLHDVGREGETDYLVMELVEGDTLAERLKRGPLPPQELLRFGIQVADALDRAHRAGVIHRDLKPGNIMLTRSGAKLMDFGLSRAGEIAGSASGSGGAITPLTQSPTIGPALTTQGTLLGTFQYMAPEQLEGGQADVRSDIWALGCVLYEMATGRRAFEGRSQASLIAAILEREPPTVGELPSGSTSAGGSIPPQGLGRLIRNCLAKDPEERVQTAHDVKLQLQGIAEGFGLSGVSTASTIGAAPVQAAPAPARRGGAMVWLGWAVAAIALLGAGGLYATLGPRAKVEAPAFRFRAAPIPNTVDMFWPRVSPDGRHLVVMGLDSAGVSRAYARPMDQLELHPIPGTEDLRRPYWSPDGREIVFVAADKIQRAPLGGGSPTVICAAGGGVDLSWGSKGMILMDGSTTDSLRVVPARGGELKPATRIDRAAGEVGSAWPCFLPDGEHFLFIGSTATATGGGNIRLGKLGSLESKLLGRSDGRVEYGPGGWVLFLRGTTLLSQKLDLGAGKLTGEPITLVDDLRIGSAAGHFSVSHTGVLAFSRRSNTDEATIRLADRTGKVLRGTQALGSVGNPRLSPDGSRLLYQRIGQGGASEGDIYVIDLDRNTDTRLTFTNDRANGPEWSPDGRRFAYVTRTPGAPSRLRIGAADGLGQPDSILVPPEIGTTPSQWAEAGNRLVFWSGAFEPYSVPAESGSHAPQRLADPGVALAQPQISPDGRWLAGVSGGAPNVHVFVHSLTGQPGRWQISSTPGARPRWSRGGREIIFESFLDRRLMAVDIDLSNGFRPGTPRPLFDLPTGSPQIDVSSWAVDPTGEKFALVVPLRARTPGIVEIATDFGRLVNRE